MRLLHLLASIALIGCAMPNAFPASQGGAGAGPGGPRPGEYVGISPRGQQMIAEGYERRTREAEERQRGRDREQQRRNDEAAREAEERRLASARFDERRRVEDRRRQDEQRRDQASRDEEASFQRALDADPDVYRLAQTTVGCLTPDGMTSIRQHPAASDYNIANIAGLAASFGCVIAQRGTAWRVDRISIPWFRMRPERGNYTGATLYFDTNSLRNRAGENPTREINSDRATVPAP
jgi:hypothetical protein